MVLLNVNISTKLQVYLRKVVNTPAKRVMSLNMASIPKYLNLFFSQLEKQRGLAEQGADLMIYLLRTMLLISQHLSDNKNKLQWKALNIEYARYISVSCSKWNAAVN